MAMTMLGQVAGSWVEGRFRFYINHLRLSIGFVFLVNGMTQYGGPHTYGDTFPAVPLFAAGQCG
jgi:hypothetical protein